MIENFLKKKVPFYTLYPAQSNWINANNENNFKKYLNKFIDSKLPVSMYLHFPFCPKQCYFCHCYTVITRDELHYKKISESLINEIDLFFSEIKNKNSHKVNVTDIHFGGGTPTVMPLEYFKKILSKIKKNINDETLKEIALEVDPRNGMNSSKLLEYSKLGINRISLGIQDFDINVQKSINRENGYDLIDNLLSKEVRSSFESINFDFIFGLPKQTIETLKETTNKLVSLKPTRVTLLNMDHRPDVYKHQKAYKETDLPNDKTKIEMYNVCSDILISKGYKKIGVNHFATGNDILTNYKNEKKIYRNPNGFSPGWAYNMIAIGPSATGKLGDYYYQNVYSIDKYSEVVKNNLFPIQREKILSDDDETRRKIIMDILNFEEINLNDLNKSKIMNDDIIKELKLFEKFEFIKFDKSLNTYIISNIGGYFINHICNIFDGYRENKYQSQREFDDGLRSLNRQLNLNKI